LKHDGTRVETRFGPSAKQKSPFKSAEGGGVSSVDYWQSRSADQRAAIVLSLAKNVDHSLKMSLKDGKKRVKRSCEGEMVYNLLKFMKTEYEVSITIALSKVQNRVAEATRVSRRTLCRVLLKEGENVETGVTMAFKLSAN